MLSRNAQGLYWIGRYLERAEHGCRLLADQLKALEDRPVEDIDRTWRRLYAGLDRKPIGGSLESNLDDEGFMLADSYTLADDLTLSLIILMQSGTASQQHARTHVRFATSSARTCGTAST